jgi:hypothetical protein
MNIVIGRGNNRQTLFAPSGTAFRNMKKTDPIEAAKITGNLLGLVRQQPKVKA